MKHRQFVRLFVVGIAALLALMTYSSVFAGQPVTQTLNPPPPSFYTCMALGEGTICRADRLLVDSPAPVGIFCGTAANPVELINADTETVRATRYYDAAGNLTRRVQREVYQGTMTDPATGAYANLTQRDTLTNDLAVPGDLDTATEKSTGTTKVYLPGGRVLVHDAGMGVSAPDGTILREDGPHALDAYYVFGDKSVMAPLCAALGSPGTP